MELLKVQPVGLKKLGLDEKWLQDRIDEDPTLLGLGDLYVIKREKRQATGGRIDFLMADQEAGVRYEIEVMLGTLDESHIIRTIEYWDVERKRFPTLEHRAVIVAEDITNRFFNVISLMNQAIPIVALQLNAFEVGGKVVLSFTKVLDVTEVGDETEEEAEQTDRAYWEKLASPKSLAVADALMRLVPSDDGEPRVAYNKTHIAVGGARRNFLWIFPRRNVTHCGARIRLKADEREAWIERLDEVGVAGNLRHHNTLGIRITEKELADAKSELTELIARGYALAGE